MYSGQFDIKLYNAEGHGDDYFESAQKEGRLDEALGRLAIEQHAQCKNRLFDNLAGYLLHKLFSVGNCDWPWYDIGEGAGAQAYLGFIQLLTTDSETTDYEEDWNRHNEGGTTGIGDRVPNRTGGGTGAKRFEEDQVTAWEVWSDRQGRDALYFRNRWLYTTSQGNATDIKSIGIYSASDADNAQITYSHWTAIGGRIRLRDATGTPITMVKTSSNVLLVEYTYALVSM